MSMTIAEKILAAHTGKDRVEPGELVEARLDFVFANDITAPQAIEAFRKAEGEKVFDPERVGMIPDHFVPNKDISSAMQAKEMRDFVREQNLPHYFEVGRMGIEHALLPEQGLVLPGDLIIGADSHTCTYGALGAFATGVGGTDLGAAMLTGESWFKVPPSLKFEFSGKLNPWVGGKDLILHTIGQIGVDGARYKAMEFIGPVIDALPMHDRFTMSNMAIEAGAKVGIIPPDDTTEQYVRDRAKRAYTFYHSDGDAVYEAVYQWDVSDLEPQVAKPHSPENAVPVSELRDIDIDQVVIGSCTNGRLEDLRNAAKVLKGRKVASNIRCIIIPATSTIYKQAPGRRIIHHLPGGRGHHIHAHLRAVPGRVHGYPGRRRTGRIHHQPQLCRADGAYYQRNLPQFSGRGRGQRRDRAHCPPGRIIGDES